MTASPTVAGPPLCAVHGTPLVPSKNRNTGQPIPGRFFCNKRNPDGSWCDQRVSLGPAPAAQASARVDPAPARPGTSPAAAALAFAGQVYQGSGFKPADGFKAAELAELNQQAIALARAALEFLKGQP